MPNQSIRECDRCTAIAKSGSRCRNRTCKGKKCWIHTKKEDGLRVKRSQIPNSGFGLYSTKRFGKGDKITNYTGEKLTKAAVDARYPGNVTAQYMYVMCRSNRECFDARNVDAGGLHDEHVGLPSRYSDQPGFSWASDPSQVRVPVHTYAVSLFQLCRRDDPGRLRVHWGRERKCG